MSVVDEDRRAAGLRVGVGRQAADVPAVAHGDQREHGDLPVLERVQRTEQHTGSELRADRTQRPALIEVEPGSDQPVELVPERPRAELGRRQVERLEVDHRLILQAPALVAEHRLRVDHLPIGQRHAAGCAPVLHQLDVGHDLAFGLRVVVAVERLEHGPPGAEIKVPDQVGAPEVQVDRALVDGGVRTLSFDAAQDLAGPRVQQHEAVGRGAAQRDSGGGVVVEPLWHEPGRSFAQQARDRQFAGDRLDVLAEELAIDARDRRLVRGAQDVAGVDLGVERVEDRRLDRPSEKVLRMAAEELVKRVLACDVDRQPPAAASGSPPHLLEACDRSGERHAHRRVELADVDPELQCVSRDDTK